MSWRATLRRLERTAAARPEPELAIGVRCARAVMHHPPAFEAALEMAAGLAALGAVPGEPVPPGALADPVVREPLERVEREMEGRWPEQPRESPGHRRGGRGGRPWAR